LVEAVNDEHRDYGPIDSIHYKGGPISQKEHSEFRRQHFTDGHKLAMRKKKDGNDDSESDNSDECDTRPHTKRKVTTKPSACVRVDSNERQLLESACDELENTQDSDCIFIPIKRGAKKSSKAGDGIRWNGIKMPSITKLFEETFGESRNGMIRVKLYAPRLLKKMRALLVEMFKCSSEGELLATLKTSSDEHFKFEFYYKSEGYLYSCITPDGLCGPRNFAVLQKGILLNPFNITN
jgi:hypothetical protein